MSKKLFVGNMPYSMTNEDLAKLFEPYGQAEEVRLIMDRMSGRSKGFGFVTLADDEMADKAIAELNGKDMGNNMSLKVDIAKPPSNDRPRRSFDRFGDDDRPRGGGGRGGFGGGRDRGGDRGRY
ncbi:MAG: RNA-binding protein [Candidatus Micrarchaeota archaeon]